MPAKSRPKTRRTSAKRPRKRNAANALRPPPVFRRYGLTPVINVSGTETYLGAAPVLDDVVQAVAELAPCSAVMRELQDVASRKISRAFGAEAGVVVHCSAAGIVTAIAGCMVGEDTKLAQRLPDTSGLRNEVIVQAGHNIDYGGIIGQNIAVTGARTVEVGTFESCTPDQLRAAITPATAAALYVVSHHTAQSGMIELRTFCEICRERGIPVIVDAAAEPDPLLSLQAGADLVIISVHKQLSGMTGGIVAGRRDLVRACYHQESGIGRPMKVGKETVVSALAAIDRWSSQDKRKVSAQRAARLRRSQGRLSRLPGVTAELEPDPNGLFSRLRLRVDPESARISAAELAARLSAGKPAIFVRTQHARTDEFRIDLRLVSDEIADHVTMAIESLLRKANPLPAPRRSSRK